MATDFESSRDTSPLALEQLSDAELQYILAIEKRLAEAKDMKYETSSNGANQSPLEPPFAKVEERHRRVLLLDGGRGTGKTSLLLTLVKKWRVDAGIDKEQWAKEGEYQTRVAQLRPSHKAETPKYIRVIRILDFDPLPPGMPLLAGIIQALRPLATYYDPALTDADHACYDDRPQQPTLLDQWGKLFRVAALGWSAIPNKSGLIEQVLDREEQVRDWLQLADDWQSFVGNLLDKGKSIQRPHVLLEDTVLVILIDDVDLQVARVQELLPVLRLLYHPRVFFIVAADQLHMIDMLKLDVFGRQNELARRGNANGDIANNRLADADRWASDLAQSAFQKVFATRNRWKVERLSCREFLAFPGRPDSNADGSNPDGSKSDLPKPDETGKVRSFSTDLSDITSREPKITTENAAEFISRFAGPAERVKLPGVMTYRSAEQLRQSATGMDKLDPIKVLARLLSQGTDDSTAVVRRDGSGVDVEITGVLSALYLPGPPDFYGPYSIVLSARPDFVFHRPLDPSPIRMSTQADNRFNFTGALMAKMLEESHFPVDAAGLGWDTYLSLAWTEWRSLQLSFAWTRYTHPRPDQLLEQTQAWARFIKHPMKPANRLERCAYAWIYHQSKFSEDRKPEILARDATKPAGLDSMDPTTLSPDAELPWKKLLRSLNTHQENPRWKHITLPLLARPELGFPPHVQKLLLDLVPKDVSVHSRLKNERRRLITDAFLASGMQRDVILGELPTVDQVDDWIKTINQAYAEEHKGKNYWVSIIDPPSKPAEEPKTGRPH